MPIEYDWIVSFALPHSPIALALFMFWLGILVLKFVRYAASLLMLSSH